MADTSPANNNPHSKGFEPEVPITTAPVLDWPPQPVATLRYLVSPVVLPYGIFWVALAALCWNYLTPSMERTASLSPRWMLQIYLRNALILVAVAGTLHLVLYARRAQQERYKYNRQWLSTTNREFLWNNQTRDNIFWSLVSGCTIWTAYESLTMWFYANDWIPQVEWSSGWPYLSVLTESVCSSGRPPTSTSTTGCCTRAGYTTTPTTCITATSTPGRGAACRCTRWST